MKRRLFKRIGATLLALVTVFALSIPAWAGQTSDGVAGPGSSVTWNDTFQIVTDDDAVNLPAATFNYTIAPGSAQDATATTPAIKAGIAGASISNAAHPATAAGTTDDTQTVTADFVSVTFPAPGIYRYDVTVAQASGNVTADDIDVDADNPGTRGAYVLDVYVKKEGAAFTPYAYVLSAEGDITEYDKTNDPVTATYGDKIDEVVHEYETYNLTVTKEIEGALAADSFEFTINIASIPAGVIIKRDNTDATPSAATKSFTATLGDGQSTVIKGLPSTVTYAIQEAVNQADGYDIEVTGYTASWIGTTAYGGTATTMGQDDVEVVFTNTLKEISPTGVILRYGAFIGILGAAMAILIVMVVRRRRDRKDELD